MADEVAISVWQFGKYVVAQYPERLKIVGTLIDQEEDGYNRASDRYRAVREGARTVFNTVPVKTDELLKIPEKIKNAIRRREAELITESMVQGWTDRSATFFSPPWSHWEGDGIRVRVTFDLGMSTSSGHCLVRNWYYSTPPTSQMAQTCLVAIELARSANWSKEWQPAIWDVRRDELITSQSSIAYGIGLPAERVGLRKMWELVKAQRAA